MKWGLLVLVSVISIGLGGYLVHLFQPKDTVKPIVKNEEDANSEKDAKTNEIDFFLTTKEKEAIKQREKDFLNRSDDTEYKVQDTLSGKNGVLTIKSLANSMYGGASLYLNDEKIAHEGSIDFIYQDGTNKNSSLVIASLYGGGSCCLPRPMFIDLSTSPPTVTKDFWELSADMYEIYPINKNKLVYESHGFTPVNEWGDEETLRLHYFGEGKFIFDAPEDKINYANKLLGEHPGRIFSEDVLGSEFKRLMTPAEYKFFSNRFVIGSSTFLEDFRYIVGDAFGKSYGAGYFVVDQITNEWLIFGMYDNGSKLKCSYSENISFAKSNFLSAIQNAFDINTDNFEKFCDIPEVEGPIY